jgi:hypothetical protein
MFNPPDHTDSNENPSPRGVVQADQFNGLTGRPPLNATLTDALTDLATDDGTSSARPTQSLCPVCTCLRKHGLAAWNPGLGRWLITPAGYAYLETRTTHPEETR